MFSNPGDADKIHQHCKRRLKMTQSLKRSIGTTFILILISVLSGGFTMLFAAVFPSLETFNGVSSHSVQGRCLECMGWMSFLLYVSLHLTVLIYGSSNVIFKLTCKKILRMLFFVLWLISYSVLYYCLLCAWIFLGFRFSYIC